MSERTNLTRVVTRDVTVEECPWLNMHPGETVVEGTVVYVFLKPTYGAVRELAVTLDPEGDYPFFELPYDSVVSPEFSTERSSE